MARTYIIAEAGVNHNGDLERAKRLVQVAAECGADAVKFQSFRAERLVGRATPKAQYQKGTTDPAESQLEMLKKLEIDAEGHQALYRECRACGIAFLSTPFDLESLELLTGTLKLSRLKLPSGEITNAPLLLAAAGSGREVILSTGMSTLGEIEEALGVLAFGYLRLTGPSLAAFRGAYGREEGQALLREKVTLLHCTTEYPAPYGEVNLKAMDTMRAAFGLPVGFSDHTEGIAVAVAAVARGAVLLEKHFTLDRTLPGPDHRASLEPAELKELVRSVRAVEQALGTGQKRPSPSEAKNQTVARKCLVAARPIPCGEPYSEANLTSKRGGEGISPFLFWDTLGRLAERDYACDEAIER